MMIPVLLDSSLYKRQLQLEHSADVAKRPKHCLQAWGVPGAKTRLFAQVAAVTYRFKFREHAPPDIGTSAPLSQTHLVASVASIFNQAAWCAKVSHFRGLYTPFLYAPLLKASVLVV